MVQESSDGLSVQVCPDVRSTQTSFSAGQHHWVQKAESRRNEKLRGAARTEETRVKKLDHQATSSYLSTGIEMLKKKKKKNSPHYNVTIVTLINCY